MAASTAERSARATYQDVLDTPAHLVAEIINRTLHTHPRPAARHALATSNLGDEFVSPFGKGRGGPGGWWILFEPEMHLGEDVLVPNLTGWHRERMPDYPDTAYFTLAPDCVCEVLSPSTRKLDLTRNAPSTRSSASATCGSSTRRTVPWRPSSSARASGCSSPLRRTTSR